ncbi:phospholipase domain-containing protein, partial [Streptomyces sp. NPDC002547]
VPRLPDTTGYLPPDGDRHPDYVPTPPAKGSLPRQEVGLRPARPIPYDLAADGKVDRRGSLRIAFASHGEVGAVFLVTSATDTSGPWTYTVGSQRSLSDDWKVSAGSRGAYDFTVHGPNGFLRQFEGRVATAGPEVSTRHHGKEGTVRLTLTNDGNSTVTLTITDKYGKHKPVSYRLRPGAHVVHAAETERTHGWYDLLVTADHDATFVRRLAAHIENGHSSTSDPALDAR